MFYENRISKNKCNEFKLITHTETQCDCDDDISHNCRKKISLRYFSVKGKIEEFYILIDHTWSWHHNR